MGSLVARCGASINRVAIIRCDMEEICGEARSFVLEDDFAAKICLGLAQVYPGRKRQQVRDVLVFKVQLRSSGRVQNVVKLIGPLVFGKRSCQLVLEGGLESIHAHPPRMLGVFPRGMLFPMESAALHNGLEVLNRGTAPPNSGLCELGTQAGLVSVDGEPEDMVRGGSDAALGEQQIVGEEEGKDRGQLIRGAVSIRES